MEPREIEKLFVLASMVCNLLGKPQEMKEIEAAFNEAVRRYGERYPPSRVG